LLNILFAALAVLFGFAFTYNIIAEYGFTPAVAKPFTVPVAAIGEQMLDTKQHGFVLPFEVVSMLLLAAMIGCIVIAMRSAPKGKPIQKQAAPIGTNGKSNNLSGTFASPVEPGLPPITKETIEEKIP
jgi:NADH-quinone oxidoreductase subunit J